MNAKSREIRKRLLRRYYKSAVLGWTRPRSQHWTKMVDSDGYWKWMKPDMGIRGQILQNPPLHLYQTVLRFRTDNPPRGTETIGYFLGGPLFFDADVIEPHTPFSLWKIAGCSSLISSLEDILRDRGQYRIARVSFSGLRGIHVFVDTCDDLCEPLTLSPYKQNREWKDFRLERTYISRSVGHWYPYWDWKVTADPWRIARIPRSIHGGSALQAMTFKPPYSMERIREQLRNATPFSLSKQVRIRITRSVPIFTFIDGESYGPFRKDWVTKLPIAVALHLVWLNFAKLRESGPRNSGNWFKSGWQMLFRGSVSEISMGQMPTGGVGG